METSGKLMACKTPMEAASVMHSFYDDAFKAYSQQALQFVNLSRALGHSVSVEDGAEADSAAHSPNSNGAGNGNGKAAD